MPAPTLPWFRRKAANPPLDPKSDEPDAQTGATGRFNADTAAQAVLAATGKQAEVNGADFDAVCCPGGHGPTRAAALGQRAVVRALAVRLTLQTVGGIVGEVLGFAGSPRL